MNYELTVIYPFLLLFGACVGSFLNVVIARLPIKGAFLSNSRSCCPECKEPIELYDLIPILSWFILKGKCRNCDEFISMRYLIIEVICALLAAVSYWRFGFELAAIPAFAVTAVLLTISVIDFKTSEIPDSLILTIALFAIVAIWAMPETTLLDRGIGLVVISVPLLMASCIKAGAFGGGDIKLMAACGFLLGWQATLLAFFIALLPAGCYAVYMILTGKRDRTQHMVFGPSICIGVTISLFYGNEIISWYLQLFVV
ncbi:MAG: prepilin peptidase [Oscillospiraceae bacterium]|jgi:leader peptidase (prepilin peptidase)/N-methyltransferase|nr:prepilin peptidase [Oscillospiraceae bacterium]